MTQIRQIFEAMISAVPSGPADKGTAHLSTTHQYCVRRIAPESSKQRCPITYGGRIVWFDPSSLSPLPRKIEPSHTVGPERQREYEP